MPNNSDLNIEGVIIAETLLRIFNHRHLDRTLKQNDNDPLKLINTLLNQIDIKHELKSTDLKNIPAKGPFIIVSNHPYRGVDSMILYKMISSVRDDFKIMGSYLLHRIEPLKNVVIPVNTFETKGRGQSFSGLKEAINHLKQGHCLGIFPVGEESSHMEISRTILDRKWQLPAIKLIKNSKVPVIPVYFHATHSRLAYIIGKIHPVLRYEELPAELKKNRIIKIRIGSSVTVKEQASFRDLSQYGRFLRAKTYSLGSVLEARKFFRRPHLLKRKAENIADPVPADALTAEFNCVRSEYELFSSGNYSVVCAPAFKIPLIFSEIGRLRELTFRKIGEGTNKSTDVDEYDLYFNHLFIWDKDNDQIVGAYRIGKGKEVIQLYGLKGFYISSLFRIKPEMADVLSVSLELGRSFIIEEYQKKAFSLFLLWKGIMFFLLRNPEYRYLVGPVSISNDFSKYSKDLIVGFLRRYFMNEELSALVSPKKAFSIKAGGTFDKSIFVDTSDMDINRIEKVIMDMEPGYRLPVLLRKYLEINGRILCFNVDPKFNYCLDCLMLLDLYKTPPEFIKGLSREMNDPSILERFSG